MLSQVANQKKWNVETTTYWNSSDLQVFLKNLLAILTCSSKNVSVSKILQLKNGWVKEIWSIILCFGPVPHAPQKKTFPWTDFQKADTVFMILSTIALWLMLCYVFQTNCKKELNIHLEIFNIVFGNLFYRFFVWVISK